MIDETLFDAEEKMEKAVSVSRDDLSTIRTGRANPSMFNRIVIDYYGSATPITQLASINVPEARLVVIKPYEASQLGQHRVGDSQFGPRGEPHQRRHPDPGGGAPADRGTSSRTGQASQGQR